LVDRIAARAQFFQTMALHGGMEISMRRDCWSVPRVQDRDSDRRCADGKEVQAEVLMRPALGDGVHEVPWKRVFFWPESDR
jgi:hypothetical protein